MPQVPVPMAVYGTKLFSKTKFLKNNAPKNMLQI